jgi:hypothetical protein
MCAGAPRAVSDVATMADDDTALLLDDVDRRASELERRYPDGVGVPSGAQR